MPDYNNAKIYKLWSPEGDDIYIGSTTKYLSTRKHSINTNMKIENTHTVGQKFYMKNIMMFV